MENIEIDDPVLATNLKNYFTKSFVAVNNSCVNCAIDSNELFNRELFDILSVENLRLENEQVVTSSKNNKYSITLLSKQDLATLIGELSVNDLILQTFPTWANSGDDKNDESKYRNDCTRWAIVLKEHYQLLTQNPNLKRVKIEDFLAMNSTNRNEILNHVGGYLLLLQ